MDRIRALNRWHEAYSGYSDLDGLMAAVRKLEDKDIIRVMDVFYGVSWEGAKNKFHMKHLERKQKLRAGIEAMKELGYVPSCSLCRQPKVTCSC